MTQNTNSRVSRRGFMKGAATVGGGIAITSFAASFGMGTAQAAEAGDDVATMANLAATAETLAATSYYNTILNNPLGYSDDDLMYLKLALSSEMYHLAILQSLGGKSLTDKFYVPATFLSDSGTNAKTFMAAETAFTGAYLAATRRFAELGLPNLAATTAQHAATEAEHLALTRMIGGFIPNPNALPAPIYYNVSNAVPTLAPFLKGGTGFIGPVPFPGADAINALLGGVKAFPVLPYVKAY